MKKIVGVFIGIAFFLVLGACSNVKEKSTAKKIDAQQLYEKYKDMITEGDGCVPCVDCAALALAISYDTKDEIKNSKKKLIEYYHKNGKIPCPELLPELKQDVAQISQK